MKWLVYINWIILAIYFLFLLISLLGLSNSGMDAAGRGMSGGFSLIGLGIVVVLSLLNLIDAKIVRLIVLALCLLPLFYALKSYLNRTQNYRQFENHRKQSVQFDDTVLDSISYAIQEQDLSSIGPLLKGKPDLNKISVSGTNALINMAVRKAAYENHEQGIPIVELLLKHGADPNLPELNSYVMIYDYLNIAPLALFKLLFDYGLNPNALDHQGVPIIYKFVRHHADVDCEKLDWLLNAGADPNASFGNEGWTLNFNTLIFAASGQHWDCCLLLIEAGVDIDFKPSSGMDFWDQLSRYKEEYTSQNHFPESFNKLLKHKSIIGRFK